jgi:hypothetical protein
LATRVSYPVEIKMKAISKAEENWFKLMNEIKEKYSETYLISNMNLA